MESNKTVCEGYPNCDCSGTCDDAVKYGHPHHTTEMSVLPGDKPEPAMLKIASEPNSVWTPTQWVRDIDNERCLIKTWSPFADTPGNFVFTIQKKSNVYRYTK